MTRRRVRCAGFVGALLLVACKASEPRASQSGTQLPGDASHGATPSGVDASVHGAPPPVGAVDRPFPLSVLVFSRSVGFRHDSIDFAVRFFEELAPTEQLSVELTDDPTQFTREGLSRFDVVAFVNTTGDVLDDAQQAAFEQFIQSGRGFVGVHSAADTEHDWPWYGELVGAFFQSHPELPLEATLTVDPSAAAAGHQAVLHLEPEFRFIDEWYNFDRNPRDHAEVLLTVDEADFALPNVPEGPSMGADHPIAWSHEFDGGRSFYTNLGHNGVTWQDPRFQEHLLEGIRWAAGGGTTTRAVLTDDLRNPLAIAVRPDGSVYIIERTGVVWLWRADTGGVAEALSLEVDTAHENGLLGIAVDPAHDENGYVYLYVSEPRLTSEDVAGPPGRNAVVRFQARGDGTLDPASRTSLLAVPSERRCCHEGGALAFAADGMLLISTGDNTNPFDAEGMAPLDARPGRETSDARRTASNPQDLRGKILRILPDGSIPPGNLFADPAEGLPHIYVMGVRNPFRIASDPSGPRWFFGDIGPDAEADGERGPRGLDEINLVDAPGDHGWPHCIGDNLPYVAYDHDTGVLGAPFDCAGKVGALIAYDYATPSHPALGTGFLEDGTIVGRSAIAGAVYRTPEAAAISLPPRHSGALVMTDWTRDVVALVGVTDAGALRSVERVFSDHSFKRPIDVEVSPDGALLVLEYGSEFWGDNADARLSRIEVGMPPSLAPIAQIAASNTHGPAPLDVTFAAEGSLISGGREITSYAWDVGADGAVDHDGATFERRFEESGEWLVSLVVTAADGQPSQPVATRIVVGNTPPTVEIVWPLRVAQLAPGVPVTLEGEGWDREDGAVPCDELSWNLGLIHNAHAHPLETLHGCKAQFTPDPSDHDPAEDLLSYSIELVTTDHGGPNGEPPLTGRQGLQFEVVAR